MTDLMPPEIREALVMLANKEAPREMCGFILPLWTEIVVLANVSERDDRFEIADKALLQFYEYCSDPLGFFHSHPSGRPSPSDRDAIYAPHGMRYWIVTLDNVYEWDMSHDPPAEIG